jgi:hypothetical protein
LSLIDTAIDRAQPFDISYANDLRAVPGWIEYLIFAVLYERLKHVAQNDPYQIMLETLHSARY